MDCDETHLAPNEKTQPIQWTKRPTGALVAAGSLWPEKMAPEPPFGPEPPVWSHRGWEFKKQGKKVPTPGFHAPLKPGVGTFFFPFFWTLIPYVTKLWC
jgi:hypothetical protein